MGELLNALPLLIIVIVFVGLIVWNMRKDKKHSQEIANMRNNLRVGDEVTTTGGIVGRIVRVNKGETVVVETSRDGTKICFLKTAIARVDVPVEAANKDDAKNSK